MDILLTFFNFIIETSARWYEQDLNQIRIRVEPLVNNKYEYMGTLKGKFIKGQVGNLVYREYQGKQIVQSAPDTPKSHRTEGTKKSAALFGKASKLAGGLRWGLGYICGKFYDGTMIYRLNAEILRCLTAAKEHQTPQFNFSPDSFRTLAGFEFNIGSMVKNLFYVQPSVIVEGTTLQVIIPEIKVPTDLKWPIDRPKCCKLLIAIGIIDLKKGSTILGTPQVMDIPYSYNFKTVESQTFNFEMIPGCLHVVGITLKYIEESFIGETTINTKSFNPAAILSAHLAEGTTDYGIRRNWQEFERDGY